MESNRDYDCRYHDCGYDCGYIDGAAATKADLHKAVDLLRRWLVHHEHDHLKDRTIEFLTAFAVSTSSRLYEKYGIL